MKTPSEPVIPRLASTILILRDAPRGMEVLMVERHHEVDFFSGALVFPGGKLAKGDADPRVLARCTGVEGLSAEQIELRAGAIREAFEESGILLARERDSGEFVGADRATRLGMRYRKPLDSGELGIADLLEAEDLMLACEGLVHFAHWITPRPAPKRYDTHFYLALAPAEQVAVHDGKEMVEAQWIRPTDAIAAQAAGKRTIVTATLFNLRKLNRSDTVAAAMQTARASRIVTVLPEIVERPQGRMMLIPEEADYGVSEYPAAARR